MTVFAPFRFAPINRWVYLPEWGPLVSHDVPFKDGLSGSIELEIRAETPLLVGGARRKPKSKDDLKKEDPALLEKWPEGLEGEVWPYRLPDGRWALPPSSLQGMVRSILEIATFARLGPWIDDKRFGIRDLNQSAAPFYRKRLIGKVKGGFLEKKEAGWWLTPCKDLVRRIRFRDIPLRVGAVPSWSEKSQAQDRYEWVSSIGPFKTTGEEKFVTKLEPAKDGTSWLVVTGNTGQTSKPKAKEFIFDEVVGAKSILLDRKVVEDFRWLHEGMGSSHTEDWNVTWRYFYEQGYPVNRDRKPFRDGGRIPVFYIDGPEGPAALGLASMFKLPHSRTTQSLLENSDSRHVKEDRADLPTLIFGRVAGSSAALKRRAAFDLAACAERSVKLVTFDRAVLLSPKASYFPTYVRQPLAESMADQLLKYETPDLKGKKPPFEPYVTYTPLDNQLFDVENTDRRQVRRKEHERPELAGIKVWPARGAASGRVRPPYLDPDESRKVSTTLRALPSGTKFTGGVRFHNLRPQELGALIWALSLGEPVDESDRTGWPTNRHRLGTGKPFGLGEIAIAIRSVRAIDMAGRPLDSAAGTCVRAFRELMEDQYAKEAGGRGEDAPDARWLQSVQIRTLLSAADPVVGKQENSPVQKRSWKGQSWEVRRFDYMELNPASDSWNDFSNAKGGGRFLKRYVRGHELRPAAKQPQPNDPPGAAGPLMPVYAKGNEIPRTGDAVAPVRRPPQPQGGGQPRVGARAKRSDGRLGTIREAPKDQRSPRWHIEWDGDAKPKFQWCSTTIFTVLT